MADFLLDESVTQELGMEFTDELDDEPQLERLEAYLLDEFADDPYYQYVEDERDLDDYADGDPFADMDFTPEDE